MGSGAYQLRQSQSGNRSRVVERFALDGETLALTRQYTAEDPLYFTGEHTGADTLFVADSPFEAHACAELMNVDYSVENE